MKSLKRIFFLVVCCLLASTGLHAQSWQDLLNKENVSKVLESVTGKSDDINIAGTWAYSGSAIKFKTDDLLKKAGGAAAAAAAKKKLDEQLAKAGVKPGTVDFIFNSDNTLIATLGKKAVKGTYAYDATAKSLALTFGGFFTMNAGMTYTSKKISLLFDADKLLLLLTYLGEQAKNPSIKAISALAGSYEGMLLGMELKKK